MLFAVISLAATLARAASVTVYNPSLTGGTYDLIYDTPHTHSTDFEYDAGSVFTSSVPPAFPGFGNSTDAPIIGGHSAVTNTRSSEGLSGPGYASQFVVPSLTVGAHYIISAFFNRGDVSTGNLYIDIAGFPGVSVVSADLSVAGNQFVYVDYLATLDTITLRLVRDGDRVAGEKAYVDDIGFTLKSDFVAPDVAVSAVPLPPAAYAGMALMGVAGLKQYREKRRAKLG
jgi:hypothetical protein